MGREMQSLRRWITPVIGGIHERKNGNHSIKAAGICAGE